MSPPVEYAEQYSLIPQWAIAVIVIGLASLLFVIVFGVGVVSFMYLYFLNKQNRHNHIINNIFSVTSLMRETISIEYKLFISIFS